MRDGAKCDYCAQPGTRLVGESNEIVVCWNHVPNRPETERDELQWNALEMARKADLTRRAEDTEAEVERLRDRIEETEFHIRQLTDARDRAERLAERAEEKRIGYALDVKEWLDERDETRAEVERLNSVLAAVKWAFDLQCPPMPPEEYVDRGAWMAHSWWNTVLGGILDRGEVGTGAGEGATGQDTGTAWVTRSTDCPEAPAQAHLLGPDGFTPLVSDADYRAAFYRVMERCEELKTLVAEHQWNALEMSREAALAERRAEEAEYHVEQLRDARDRAERQIERVERLADPGAKCDFCDQTGYEALICLDHAARAVTPRYTSSATSTGGEAPFYCYPCARGDHDAHKVAWVPDVPCECPPCACPRGGSSRRKS